MLLCESNNSNNPWVAEQLNEKATPRKKKKSLELLNTIESAEKLKLHLIQVQLNRFAPTSLKH